ncbi:hypothetical protein LZ554_009008 [Drepanopeziza brunnea f. sp. 'monogermtubi']|nr:hypothetical protein LZ554_009008 [Drepanopeziza brunnea f. sp. 'monogermtubi']
MKTTTKANHQPQSSPRDFLLRGIQGSLHRTQQQPRWQPLPWRYRYGRSGASQFNPHAHPHETREEVVQQDPDLTAESDEIDYGGGDAMLAVGDQEVDGGREEEDAGDEAEVEGWMETVLELFLVWGRWAVVAVWYRSDETRIFVNRVD